MKRGVNPKTIWKTQKQVERCGKKTIKESAKPFFNKSRESDTMQNRINTITLPKALNMSGITAKASKRSDRHESNIAQTNTANAKTQHKIHIRTIRHMEQVTMIPTEHALDNYI